MESFRGFDHKYKYKIGGHSGDSEKLEFVKEGTGVGLLVGCTLASLSFDEQSSYELVEDFLFEILMV